MKAVASEILRDKTVLVTKGAIYLVDVAKPVNSVAAGMTS
jgi:hypothetical protein